MSREDVTAVAEAMFLDSWPDSDMSTFDRAAYEQMASAAIKAHTTILLTRAGITSEDVADCVRLSQLNGRDGGIAISILIASLSSKLDALTHEVTKLTHLEHAARAMEPPLAQDGPGTDQELVEKKR